MPTSIIDDIVALFATSGHWAYGAVTLDAHMRQTAALAASAGAPPTLVAAALLHDIGYFLHPQGMLATTESQDSQHEARAVDWLASHFPADVTRPIGLHVEAKRYLCATEPRYWRELDEVSRAVLKVHGGMMDVRECESFERRQGFAEALRLRDWDDRARDCSGEPPPLLYFRPILEAVLER